jgi:hypothetical protein
MPSTYVWNIDGVKPRYGQGIIYRWDYVTKKKVTVVSREGRMMVGRVRATVFLEHTYTGRVLADRAYFGLSDGTIPESELPAILADVEKAKKVIVRMRAYFEASLKKLRRGLEKRRTKRTKKKSKRVRS